MKRLLRFLIKRRLFIFIFIATVSTITVASLWQVFTLPNEPQLSVIRGHTQSDSVHCYRNDQAHALDENGELRLLVWNIYKQNNESWRSSLVNYTVNTQLALLQEVSMTREFKDYIATANWYGSHVDAFSSFDISSGVLNLSIQAPLLACAHLEVEPWLRLPKSGIFARYHLSNQQTLAVVNLHSVNFAYGNDEYTRQLASLAKELQSHRGPIIFAGDFNTWNPSRIAAVQTVFDELGLVSVNFTPDNRTQFINGLALDHIYYRGLTVLNASSLPSAGSDHNPLFVQFSI